MTFILRRRTAATGGGDAAVSTAVDHDLDAFRSPADLLELAAILDRHSDAEAQPLRDRIDWTRAA